ncbi:GDSL family lipase [Brevundimonas sp. LM2]|uniref:SGNH/GDSL hydrolase family protein n=1 Tax=Brevundimonas sp. LM2 TaxID=1938605 RepID=UPI0009839C27|nr:SGNH/GDSL hydrolase family protein [Brevundimonas sp. LM2]AQR63100.1 GDSL family lipase [Brevundimonas sp. LM2]
MKILPGRLLRVLALLALAFGAPAAAQEAPRPWTASWASAQMLSDGDNALPAIAGDVTLRQILRLSAGGDRLRIRVSNRFGREPLALAGGSVARAVGPGQARIMAGSATPITFAGQTAISIPAEADYVSDAISLPVAAGADIAVSLHLSALPPQQTGHPGARASTYVAAGDRLVAATIEDTRIVTRWYLLAAVDVEGRAPAVIALLGDSITDGYGVPADSNQRWPDRLAERLRATPGLENAGVLNLGIWGNRMLRDGLGPNVMARLDRDVLSQSGVTHLVLLEGVNDLGVLTRDAPATPDAHAALVRDLIAAYAQLVAQARAAGVVAIGATIMPFAGSGYYHPGAETEADRNAVNAWIRTPGNFDAVIDFDAVTRDPDHPERLRPEVDGGDGLHPSLAGYRAMGDAVPLTLFRTRP